MTTGTGLKGRPLEEVIKEFYGDITTYPLAPDGHNYTQAQIRAVCQHISDTGDCHWHACFVVVGGDYCGCAQCRDADRERLRVIFERNRREIYRQAGKEVR